MSILRIHTNINSPVPFDWYQIPVTIKSDQTFIRRVDNFYDLEVERWFKW